MIGYQIRGFCKVCSATGRELRPGERFVSALVTEGGTLARQDYAADAWPGPPPGTVGFWSGTVPVDGAKKKPAAVDDNLLADGFAHLADSDDPEKRNFRYVLALLLLRRKRFRFEEVKRTPRGEVLVLRDAKGGARHEVLDPRLGVEDLERVQAEVFRVLGWE